MQFQIASHNNRKSSGRCLLSPSHMSTQTNHKSQPPEAAAAAAATGYKLPVTRFPSRTIKQSAPSSRSLLLLLLGYLHSLLFLIITVQESQSKVLDSKWVFVLILAKWIDKSIEYRLYAAMVNFLNPLKWSLNPWQWQGVSSERHDRDGGLEQQHEQQAAKVLGSFTHLQGEGKHPTSTLYAYESIRPRVSGV